jgi:hypothetical protein
MTQEMLALVENAEPSNWTTDPAQLNFTDYRNRQLWGPPDNTGKRQCINMALLANLFPTRSSSEPILMRTVKTPISEPGKRHSISAAATW